MGRPSATRVVEEYAPLRDPAADPMLEAVKAAVALEDGLGLRVAREFLDPTHLGTDEAMLATARRLIQGH